MIVSALLLSAAGIAAAPTGVRGRRSFAWRNPLSPTAESVHRKVREKIAEKIKIACRVWTLLCLAAHGRAFAGDATGSARQAVSSPDGRLELAFESDARGMRWSLARDGRTLVRPSRLGVLFAAASPSEEGSERLAEMRIAAVTRGSSDTTWKTTLSRRGTIRDRHNEMTVELVEAEPRGARAELGSAHAEKTPRRLGLVFRAYDEGVAFRYAFPRQEAFDGFVLKDEQTEWTFGEGTSAWVAPYETGVAGSPPEGQFAGEYVRLALAALDPGRLVGQPVLVEAGCASLALCEAALSNWAGLHYRAAGIEVLRSLPTTWRDTRPLEGRCGEYYAALRESFGGRFYYAATTVKPRDLELSLDFLGDDAWKMVAYVDDKKRTPLDAKAVLRQERTVRKGEKVRFELCPEGGAVALFVNERSSGR